MQLIKILLFYVIGLLTGLCYSNAHAQSHGCGTGFLINTSGYIVTAGHVAMNNMTGIIYKKDGNYYTITRVYKSPYQDLAIFHIDDTKTYYKDHPNRVFLKLQSVSDRQEIAIYGYPLPDRFGHSLKQSLGHGYNQFKLEAGKTVFYYYGQSYPGNSGGPIMTAQGGVVGVLVVGMGDTPNKDDGASEGWGVTSEGVIQALIAAGIPYSRTENNQSKIDFYYLFEILKEYEPVMEICT